MTSKESPVEDTDNVTLTCNEATTNNVSSYEWYFNDEKKVGEASKTIEIGSKRNASGKYECKVVTRNGTSVKSIKKNVLYLCEL